MADIFNSTSFAPNALDVIFVNAEQRLVAVFAGVSLALIFAFLICLRVVDWLMTRFRWRWKSNPVSADRRQALAVLYNSSQIAFYVEMGFLLLSIVSVGIFAYLAIEVGRSTKATVGDIFKQMWLRWIEFVVSICFAAQLMFHFFASPNLISYVLSAYTIATLLTVIPGIIAPFTGNYVYFFLILRIVSLLRALQFLRSWGWKPLQGYTSEIIIYWVKIFSTIMCASGFMFVAENSVQNPEGQVNDLLDALYLMVVTLTTVGYGDIVPKSVLGRIVICVLVLLSISFLPKETARFLKILTSSKSKAYNDKRHVVLGAPMGADIGNFLREFFHEDRMFHQGNVCIVAEADLDANTIELLKLPEFALRVSYIKGHLKNKEDMSRASIQTAEACFLLSAKSVTRANGDADTILAAMNLMTMNENLKIYIQLMNKQHKMTAKARGIRHVLCVSELRLSMLAQNCIYPGLFPLVANLIRSSTPHPEMFAHNQWLSEYEHGMGQELYSDKEMFSFAGLKFMEAVAYIYLKYGCVLVGLRVYTGPNMAQPMLLMNPGLDYAITEIDVGFIISPREHVVHSIVYEEDVFSAQARRVVSERRSATPTPRRGSFAHDELDDDERYANKLQAEQQAERERQRELVRRRSMVDESDHSARFDAEEEARAAEAKAKKKNKKRSKKKQKKQQSDDESTSEEEKEQEEEEIRERVTEDPFSGEKSSLRAASRGTKESKKKDAATPPAESNMIEMETITFDPTKEDEKVKVEEQSTKKEKKKKKSRTSPTMTSPPTEQITIDDGKTDEDDGKTTKLSSTSSTLPQIKVSESPDDAEPHEPQARRDSKSSPIRRKFDGLALEQDESEEHERRETGSLSFADGVSRLGSTAPASYLNAGIFPVRRKSRHMSTESATAKPSSSGLDSAFTASTGLGALTGSSLALAASGIASESVIPHRHRYSESGTPNPDVEADTLDKAGISYQGPSFVGLSKVSQAINMFVEPEIIEKCVIVTDELNSFEKANLHTIAGAMEGHIVVLGFDNNIVDFITLLRLKSLRDVNALRPIVLLGPELPSQVVWNSLCIFPDVYFVQGSTTVPRDLKRASVETAWRVVILANPSSLSEETLSVPSHADAKSILTFRMLKQITKAEVIIELSYTDNIRFLSQTSPLLYLPKPDKNSPKQDQEKYEEVKAKYKEIRQAGSLYNPYYASGAIVIASALDLLVCQTYFNSDIIRITEKLVEPESIHIVTFRDLRENVPEFKEDKDYFAEDAVVHFLSADQAIVLAVLRKGNGSLGRYLITAPSPQMRLLESDHFFVLRPSKPRLSNLPVGKSTFNLMDPSTRVHMRK